MLTRTIDFHLHISPFIFYSFEVQPYVCGAENIYTPVFIGRYPIKREVIPDNQYNATRDN